MACHNHGRREQTLEDIMTPEELAAARVRLDAWTERTYREVYAETCVCRDPWQGPTGGYHMIQSRCVRCITLQRLNKARVGVYQCCDPALTPVPFLPTASLI